MIMKLEDKIALVTGSTSRIGAATARALTREGGQAIGARSERSARSNRRDTTNDP
jgi:NAD(P)-dependent dehydrogenase (short-subunit alcohol dehydrogenase family)